MAGASRTTWTVIAVLAATAAGAGYLWSGGAVPGPVASALNTVGIKLPQPAPATAQAPATPAPAAGQASGGGNRQGGGAGGRPPVSVVVATAERKPMPVRLEAIGQVQTIASVTLRSRVESQITEVAFEDGARVKQGDVLVRLDHRQIDAQIAQAEANVARDRAALTSAEAELRRTEALARRDFATDQRLDTARASVAQLQAAVRGGEAQIDNLKVQRTFYTIVAPISGRVGVAGLKPGNIAKTGDGSVALGIINQTSPIYVSFALPQRQLPEVRAALAAGTAKALATPQGFDRAVEGQVAVIDNAVDAQTGTISLRAVFENADELLWPGALCQVRLTLRVEPNALTVPREAVQSGQTGNFVFAVVDGVARAKPVVIDRIVDNLTVLKSGLDGNETIVVDGQQQLADGVRVNIRQRPGSGQPAAGGTRPAVQGESMPRVGSAG